ncbi:metallophosphoesterase [Chitinophaga sp. SYP-B3965]|uniref:metallophosphoesterase family protein n=1 Tax=Chitinophaga sp. SYP-B3965 TaxID=2663120 RepID=UPI001564B759|nr:metallophosphoesterase [Chitinophaga sp. SYP-B3965]
MLRNNICFLLILFSLSAQAQDVSFIALGDMHYDRLDDHDLDYVMTRPQDFEQIFKEYPQYTAFYMPKFLQLIKKQTGAIMPAVKAVVQLGDLVEGVAGNDALARQMNRGVVDLLHSVKLPVPWVLVKGNHDVSNSPGQPEAWEEVIRPFMEGQVGKSVNHGMYTYKLSNNTEFFVLDQFFSTDRNVPETEMVAFLEKELKASTARYKFVLTHQPVIPVTQRCWHVLAGIRRPLEDTTLRTRFLNLLAKHKAIVLAAHLHEYSVLSRATPSGNIVQVMINSVNRGLEPPQPKDRMTEYGGDKWVEEKPDWQPATKEVRTRILAEEKKHILQFSRADLPGYAVISMDDAKGVVMLNYYNGFAEKPFETINLTELQQK